MTSPARRTKTALNEQFARIGRALGSPRRTELLDLLAQGEHSVEVLAAEADMSVTLTSAHLQALRRARLVESRRDGPHVLYRLAGDEVFGLLTAVRTVARARLGEVEQVVRDYFGASDELQPIGRDELLRRVRQGDLVVIDLRPRDEYLQGHLPGAISLPLAALESIDLRAAVDAGDARPPVRFARVPDARVDIAGVLPAGVEIAAYCRGPYCVMAPQGIALLRGHGRRARRIEDGVGEWRLAGLP